MLIHLYGSDSYRRIQKLKEIISEFKKKHLGLAIRHFDLDNYDNASGALKNFTLSQSLFETKKLGIIHNIKTEHKELKKFLKELVDDKDISLILVSEKKLGKLFEFLFRKPALSQEFNPLKGTQLANFIKKEIEKRKLKPSVELIDFLIRSFEGNLWGIITELEKISLGGKAEKITRAPEFFSLIQIIKGRTDLKYRLPALTYLLENDDPAKIFNITAAVATAEQKQKMADLDAAIKSGKLEYEDALLSAILSF